MTPRPQPQPITVTAAPPPVRKPLRDHVARFSAWAASASRRAVDLSWLAKGRDVLLLLGLSLLVHALWQWSPTAAEALAGLELLWLWWSMTPPADPPKPTSAPSGGRI